MAGNGLVLDDPFVSSRHARIDRPAGRWELTDVGSTNGTLLGGVRVYRSELPPGLPITLGDSELVLEIGAPREGRLPGSYEGMFSLDPGMRQVFDLIDRLAPAETAVTHPRRDRHRQGARGPGAPRPLTARRGARSSR